LSAQDVAEDEDELPLPLPLLEVEPSGQVSY
jgi:hypothetical protein